MTSINQSKTLTETIIIIMKIDNKLYQVRTNNRYSEIQRNIVFNIQRSDFMNLNANEVNKKIATIAKKKSYNEKMEKNQS